MYNRITPFTILFLSLALLQVFILDRLTFGVSFTPLAYILFIALIPMQSTQLQMILYGVLMGVAMDIGMGMAGVNTIVTLFVAYTRIYLLNYIMGKDIMEMGGTPTTQRVGWMRMVRYLGLIIFIHSLLFFSLESLSFKSMLFQLQRFAISYVSAVILGILITMLFAFSMHRKEDK